MNKVDVVEVSVRPGVQRFRLAGELDDASVSSVVRSLAPRLGLPGDLLLDLRALRCRDGSVILLFTDLATELSGRGRLYLLFPQDSVRRLVEAFGLEEELLNVKLVRHPAGRGRVHGTPPAAPPLTAPVPGIAPAASPVPLTPAASPVPLTPAAGPATGPGSVVPLLPPALPTPATGPIPVAPLATPATGLIPVAPLAAPGAPSAPTAIPVPRSIPAPAAAGGTSPPRIPVASRIARLAALPAPGKVPARPRRVHRLALRWQPE